MLIGTAIATVIRVSFRACRPFGLVTASKDWMKPSSNVRMKIIATGISSNAER